MSNIVLGAWDLLQSPRLSFWAQDRFTSIRQFAAVFSQQFYQPLLSEPLLSAETPPATQHELPTQPEFTESFSSRQSSTDTYTVQNELQHLFTFSTPLEFFLLVALPVSASFLFVHHVCNNVFATIRVAIKVMLVYILAMYLRTCGENFMALPKPVTEL